MLGGPADWDAISSGRDDFRALDLWDYSGSLDEVGEQIACKIEATGDPEPVLLGYSMGGRIALHALVAKPRLWKRAIIISAHPGLASEAEREQRLAADRVWADKARTISWSDFLTEWNAQPVLADQEKSSAQLKLENRRERVAAAFESWSLGEQQHVASHLTSCHFPITWVTGEEDQKFTELGAEMGQVIPDFEHRIIEGCAHRVIFEKPDAIARMLG